MLRGLLLQHDCNITATRTATQPRNAVFYHTICVFDLAKARSLSKRFKTFKHGAGQVYPVNYSVAWLCCSSCCSCVAVQVHATQQDTFHWHESFWQLCPTKVATVVLGSHHPHLAKKHGIHELNDPNSRPLKPWPKLRRRNVTSTVALLMKKKLSVGCFSSSLRLQELAFILAEIPQL